MTTWICDWHLKLGGEGKGAVFWDWTLAYGIWFYLSPHSVRTELIPWWCGEKTKISGVQIREAHINNTAASSCLFSVAVHQIMEKEMATHSSILAWRIPWTEEPGGLQSTGSQRVGHDWATSLCFVLLCPDIVLMVWGFQHPEVIGTSPSAGIWTVNPGTIRIALQD